MVLDKDGDLTGGHLADFKAALLARGNTPGYVTVTIGRVSSIVKACGFRYWSDIEAARIQKHLAGLRSRRRAKMIRA